MVPLFDSEGNHIANFVNNQLHNTDGVNVGHFIPSLNFFIDMKGIYLGEIHQPGRLFYRSPNTHEGKNYSGKQYGNAGKVGRLHRGKIVAIEMPIGYKDVPKDRLK